MASRLPGRGAGPTPARESYDELPSTQDRAIELLRVGAPDGTRVVAARQSSGRGRLDHAWSSPRGGLYVSIVVSVPIGRASLLPVAIGATLADRLRRECGVATRLKWPNDLLVVDGVLGPRKLAGVLVDGIGLTPEGFLRCVAGIGVNVALRREELPTELAPTVAILAEIAAIPPSLPSVETATAAAVDSAARALASEPGTQQLLEEIRRMLYGLGRSAIVDGVRVGRIVGVADDGALEVDGAAGRVAIRTGDLRVDEPE